MGVHTYCFTEVLSVKWSSVAIYLGHLKQVDTGSEVFVSQLNNTQ